MGWSEVLLIVVAFCGGYAGPGKAGLEEANLCRHERVQCIKNAVSFNPNGNNAEDLIDACLDNPEALSESEAQVIPIAGSQPFMNPQEALKLVQEDEARVREASEKEEKRLGWIKIARGVALELGLQKSHKIDYHQDMQARVPYCRQCGGEAYYGTLDEDGPCIRPYTEDVGAAFEMVDHITARGWSVAFVLDPAHPYDKVLIQCKPRTQSLVEIMFRHDSLPKAIVGMAAAWARKQRE